MKIELTPLQRAAIALALNISRTRLSLVMPQFSEKQLDNLIEKLASEGEEER